MPQDFEEWDMATVVALGEPPQNFTLKVSTGWADTFVPSVDCTDPAYCDKYHKFNSSRSHTFGLDGRKVRVHENGAIYAWGVAAEDTLHVGGLSIKHQEFALADVIRETYFSNPQYDGPLGLARRTVIEYPDESDLLAQSAFQNIIAEQLLDHNLFAIKYPKPNRSNGELTLGYLNEDAYSGELVHLPIIDLPSGRGLMSKRKEHQQESASSRYNCRPFPDATMLREDEPGIPDEDDYVFFSGGWQVEAAAISVGTGAGAFRLDLPGYIAGIITDSPVIALHPSIVYAIASRINGGNLAFRCGDSQNLPDLTFSLVGRGGLVHDFILSSKDYVSQWLHFQLGPLIPPGYC